MPTSKLIAVIGCILHIVFAVGEIVPLRDGMPFIVKSVIEKKGVEFTNDDQLNLVLNIVHNAGTYNFVVAMGFLWAAFPIGFGVHKKHAARLLQMFFFIAAILLGLVGLSLSVLTASQSVLGLIGLLALTTQRASLQDSVENN
jgi:uncharacterized membrane protein